MAVTIYHNPRCNTSRKTLALLREKGVEPQIVEYLKTPYTAAQLKELLGQLKMPASRLLRKKEAAAAGIDPAGIVGRQLIAAMVNNPIIVERPIVVSGGKAALGRPPEGRARRALAAPQSRRVSGGVFGGAERAALVMLGDRVRRRPASAASTASA